MLMNNDGTQNMSNHLTHGVTTQSLNQEVFSIHLHTLAIIYLCLHLCTYVLCSYKYFVHYLKNFAGFSHVAMPSIKIGCGEFHWGLF